MSAIVSFYRNLLPHRVRPHDVALQCLQGEVVKLLLKSLLAGIVGSALFFFFFMMATVATLSAAARLNSQALQHGVVVMPAEFLRRVGLPLTAAVFLVSFVLAHRRFRRDSR